MPASCNCTSSTLPSSNSIQAVGCLDSINSSKDILGIKIKANIIEPRAIEIEKEKKRAESGPEERSSVMVKWVANNGVHDVKKEYRKLSVINVLLRPDGEGRNDWHHLLLPVVEVVISC